MLFDYLWRHFSWNTYTCTHKLYDNKIGKWRGIFPHLFSMGAFNGNVVLFRLIWGVPLVCMLNSKGVRDSGLVLVMTWSRLRWFWLQHWWCPHWGLTHQKVLYSSLNTQMVKWIEFKKNINKITLFYDGFSLVIRHWLHLCFCFFESENDIGRCQIISEYCCLVNKWTLVRVKDEFVWYEKHAQHLALLFVHIALNPIRPYVSVSCIV